MSLILPMIKLEWSLSKLQLENISSSFFVGTMTGSLLTGLIADKVGRKKVLIIIGFLQVIFTFCF